MSQTLKHIANQVTDIVKNELGWLEPIPQGVLSDKLDSMQLLALSVAIEDHYEICFEPEEEEKTLTFNDLVELIASKIGDGCERRNNR